MINQSIIAIMITGYNHNIEYANKVFHVQTEDSGPPNCVITTEIFIGGNIIESRKDIYSQSSEPCPDEDTIRSKMQKQHKAMMKELISGAFDAAIAHRAPSAQKLDGPAPFNVEAGQNNQSAFLASESPTPKVQPASQPHSPSAPHHSPRLSRASPNESLRDSILRYLAEQD